MFFKQLILTVSNDIYFYTTLQSLLFTIFFSVSKRTAKKVSQVVAEKKTIIEKSPPVKNLRSNSPVKKLESKLPVKVLENKSPVKILENKSPVKKLEDKSTVKTSISKTTDTAKNVTNTSMNKSRRKKQPTKVRLLQS